MSDGWDVRFEGSKLLLARICCWSVALKGFNRYYNRFEEFFEAKTRLLRVLISSGINFVGFDARTWVLRAPIASGIEFF